MVSILEVNMMIKMKMEVVINEGRMVEVLFT